MSPFIVVGGVAALYGTVGVFVYALCKVSSVADQAIEKALHHKS